MSDLWCWAVQVGFSGSATNVLNGTAGDDAITWTDITAAVRVGDGVEFSRGRTSDQGTVSAGGLRFRLNNDTGAWSPGRTDLLAAWVASTFTTVDDFVAAYPEFLLDPSMVTLIGKPVRVVYDPDGVALVLWTGVVESVESGWVNGLRGVASVRAVDAAALAGQTDLRAGPVAELLTLRPYQAWIYPLDESAAPCADIVGPDSFGMSGSALSPRAVGVPGLVDAEVSFGGSSPGSIPGEAESTVAVFTGADALNGWCLDTRPRPLFDLPDLTPGAFGTTVGLWMAPGSPGRIRGALAVMGSGLSALTIRVTATNAPQAVLTDAGLTLTLTAPSPVLANEWCHVAVVMEQDGTSVDAWLMVDGTAVASGTIAAPMQGLGRRQIAVGVGAVGADPFDGAVSTVHALTIALAGAALSRVVEAGRGADSDLTTVRASRLLRYGLALAPSYSPPVAGVSTMCPQHTKGQTLAAALDVAAQAEGASWWALPAGPIRMGSRAAYWSPTPALTMPAVAVDPSTGFVLDVDDVVNTVTVQRPGGAQIVRRNEASIATFRQRGPSSPVALHVASDAQAESWADDLVARYGSATPRTATLTVEAVTVQATVVPGDVLAVDIDDVVEVTDLPDDAPAATLRFVVLGITDRITAHGWSRTFNVGRAPSLTDPWVLGTDALDSTAILAL